MKQGKVLKSTGKRYTIELEEGKIIQSGIRGKIRLKGLKTTNPVSVGDHVQVEMQDDETGMIVSIFPRDNYIIRKSVNLSKESHIIAANVDRAYLLVTLIDPETSLSFIDRFLVSAEAYRIPVTLLINKMDYFIEEEQDMLDEWVKMYENIGYTCRKISALKQQNITFLKEEIKGKQVVISGHSGTGKSTLVNQLDSSMHLKTSAISSAHGQGQHTTTFAEMHQLKSGGYIIDTPGIRSFGIIDLEKEVLSHYFPEMRALLNKCRFHNCQHLNEPGCAVKEAVEKGEIYASRYYTYVDLMTEDRDKTYR